MAPDTEPPRHVTLVRTDDPSGPLEFDAWVVGPEDGVPVLLLHGWPETALSWSGVLPRLAAAGCRCVAVDQRGYSPRARPADVAAYTLDNLVADARAFLAALGWSSAHVVGHDWGAAVSWALAARHPSSVRSLTALSVPHPAAYAQAWQDDPHQRERSAYIGLLQTEQGLAEGVLLGDDAHRLRRMYGRAVPPEVVDAYVQRLSEPGAMTAVLAWYRALDRDTWASLPPVSVPTTYVWGTTDQGIAPAAAYGCLPWMTGPHKFVELDGSGHWLPEEVPAEVADAVLERVRSVEPLG